MEVDKGSMTVVLRDRVAKKTRKTVELVGNKGGGGGDKGCGGGGGEGKHEADKNEEGEKKDDDKEDNKCGDGGNAGKGKGSKDNKKPAVPVIVTVVLKISSVGLHCDGCMRRIRSKLFKIKGVEQVRMDLPKNQVTVVGTMDAKALPEKLRKKLRRPVDVVPSGKDKDKDKEGKQQQQGYSKEGCNKDGKQQGDGKQSKEAAEKAIAAELELWKTAYYDSQGLQATQFLLSDENPNACSVTGLVLLIAVVFWGAGVWNRFMRVTETTCGAPIQSALPVQSTPPTSSSQPGWLSMAVAGLCGDKEKPASPAQRMESRERREGGSPWRSQCVAGLAGSASGVVATAAAVALRRTPSGTSTNSSGRLQAAGESSVSCQDHLLVCALQWNLILHRLYWLVPVVLVVV